MSILTRSYAKEADLVTRNVVGETIIVPVKSNVGDLDSIYTLNELGTMIWELIDGQRTVNQIAEEVCIAYDIGPEEARKDSLEFLESLEEAGLIQTIKD
jgi:hypothetical protein